MNLQETPLASIYAFTAVLAAVIGAIAWSRRSRPGGTSLSMLLFAVAEWSFAYVFEAATITVAAKTFWSQVAYLGIVSSPVFLFLFALGFSQQEHWISPRIRRLLWVVPGLTLVAALTNGLHGLVWRQVTVVPSPVGLMGVYAHGVWLWVAAAYSYALVALATFALIRMVLRSSGLYRSQAIALLLASLAPLAASVTYFFGLGPIPGLDATPIGFAVAAILLAYSLLRQGLLDVAPVARQVLIDSMSDGMLILDERGRLVDLNPAAAKLLELPPGRAVGQPMAVALAAWPDLLRACQPDTDGPVELHTRADPPHTLDVQVTPLQDHAGHVIGRLVALRDISELKRAEESERQQRRLAEALRDAISALNSTLELDQVLDRILADVVHVLPHDAANLMIVEDGICRVARCRGYAERGIEEAVLAMRLPLDETSNLRQMAEIGRPFVMADTHASADWVDFPHTRWVRAYVSAPIVVDGHAVGFLNLDSATPGFYEQEHAERLQAFADQAAIAFRNARLFARANRRAELMATLNRVGTAVASDLSLDSVLRALYEQCRQVAPADAFYVALFEKATQRISFPLFLDRDQPSEVAARCLDSTPGLTGHVIRTRQTLYVPDTEDASASSSVPPIYTSTGADHTRSFVGVPLVWRDEVVGVLSVQSYRPNAYHPDHISLMETIGTQVAAAIANARLFEVTQHARETAESTARELAQQLDELAQRNAELDAFAHTVAHDLKSPLAMVAGYAELLIEGDEAIRGEEQQYLRAIYRHAQKMSSIVDELLLLASVRKAEITVEPLNMRLIVAEARARLAEAFESAGAEVLAPETWPLVLGHASWVEEVWVNYLNNALKYGGEQLHIELGFSPGALAAAGDETGANQGVHEQICFWVQDYGPGLTPEQQARLFVPFTRLGQVRTKGHGLGLSIVQRIVEKLGGRVGVISSGIPGAGSRFWFTLPAA